MYQAGVPTRYMRICEPFGPEQRQGLWLYHVIEPERWAAMCARVSGVKSGGIYAGHDNHFYGHRKILKPEHLSWQEYAMLLLNSMPETTAEHYRNKIAVYLQWYKKKAWIISRKLRKAILVRKIFLHGDVSAKSC
jgi:predicted phosphoadenosine phosphosulfate sulfurtransferase